MFLCIPACNLNRDVTWGNLQSSKIGHVFIQILFLDIEDDVREAKCTTKFLETEKMKVSEKPQTNAEYVRYVFSGIIQYSPIYISVPFQITLCRLIFM